jgi:hypothetical protein
MYKSDEAAGHENSPVMLKVPSAPVSTGKVRSGIEAAP